MTEPPDALALAFATAQTQQQLADAALKKLHEHTRGLDTIVRETVRTAMLEQLKALHVETDRTVEALRRVHRRALNRVFVLTLASAAFGLALGLTPMFVFIPSPEEIVQRQATVAALNAQGARAQLNPCADAHGHPRLCVRIDRTAGAFGPIGDYAVIHTE